MKKFLSIITTLALCLSMLPVTALAERSDTDILYAVTDGNIYFDADTGEITDCDESVTAAEIPDAISGTAVTSIGGDAFDGCSGLTSITIPNGVTKIADGAFGNCGLTDISVDSENPNYASSEDGVLFDKQKSILICYPRGKSNSSYAIPDSVASIGDSAFCNCYNLTSVTIPNSVTSIGRDAFYQCINLANITIPDGVTSIADSTFQWCDRLTSITIPDNVTSIGDLAFDGCSGLTGITIPASVTSIGGLAFAKCSSLTSITVELENPNYASENGTLFDKQKSILICYPEGKSNSSYAIPDGVTSIEPGAFKGCSSLAVVTMPDSVTSIGYSAFEDCDSLTDVYYAGSESRWGEITIETDNDPLLSATIHYGRTDPVTYLVTVNGGTGGGDYEAGETVTITAIVPDGQQFTGWTVDEGDVTLADPDSEETTFTMPESDITVTATAESGGVITYPVTGGNIYFDAATGTIIGCDESVTAAEIPGTINKVAVTSIGGYAFSDSFSDRSNLTSITIPDGVTSIGDSAFCGCSGLTSITIPDSVTSVGDSAFSKCSGLISMTIPDGVTNIGERTFYECSRLTSITISDSVTSIGEGAFCGCSGLTGITIPASVTSIGGSAFMCYNLSDVYFSGTRMQWKNIEVDNSNWSNQYLLDASIHCIDDPTVTYDANGGTGDMESITLTMSDVYVLPACGFTSQTGKEFKAWQINGEEYAPGSTYDVIENITVTAVWQDEMDDLDIPQTYTVTVIGGTGGGDYEVGEDVTITAIVPDGQRFTGWIVDEGNVTLADPDSEVTTFIMSARDVTVTATYESIYTPPPQTYTVTVNRGFGGGRYEVGETVTIKAVYSHNNHLVIVYCPAGMRFAGWIVVSVKWAGPGKQGLPTRGDC